MRLRFVWVFLLPFLKINIYARKHSLIQNMLLYYKPFKAFHHHQRCINPKAVSLNSTLQFGLILRRPLQLFTIPSHYHSLIPCPLLTSISSLVTKFCRLQLLIIYQDVSDTVWFYPALSIFFFSFILLSISSFFTFSYQIISIFRYNRISKLTRYFFSLFLIIHISDAYITMFHALLT